MQQILTANFFKIAFAGAAIFIIIDLIWLALVVPKLYLNQLGYLAEIVDGKIKFNLPIGHVTQLIIGLGLAFFVTLGLKIDNTLGTGIMVGAIAGFVTYITYDLTSLSFSKTGRL